MRVEKTTISNHEDVRISNYLATESAIAKFRWFVVVFFFLHVNILRPYQWPVALFNGILLGAAVYNFCVHILVLRSRTFFPALSLLFMYGDMLAVATGMYFTGGAASPFLFIWYLTLFTAGIRFGFPRSFLLQVPMAVYYVFLLFREPGIFDPDFLSRIVLGLFSLSAVAGFGAIFSREEKFTFRVLEGFHRSSITDRLTGLYNYSHFMDELKKEHARALRTKSRFALIIFDIDFFKKINDSYGHEKGNLLLKGAADILKASARKMDTVARYGGEEFVIVMPDSKGAEMEAAERIRRKVEETEFLGIAAGAAVRITISGGVSSFPEQAQSVNDLLDVADQGLYEAKRCGRNRICTAPVKEDP